MTDFIEKNFTLAPNSDAHLVAILLCTYNGARFLAEQLDSLEAQAHQNWVVIASDDGSTDQTLEILQQYQAKWPSGKLTIRSGPQKGFSQNFLSLACDPKIKASELIWASPRELLNIFQADDIGCHVITVTNDILKKLSLVGYDLDQYSLDTVKMFYKDAVDAGFKL